MQLKLMIGSNTITKNNNNITIDVAPFLLCDRTFVPVRAIAEMFGYNVSWNEKVQEVTISNEDMPHFDTIEQCVFNWAMTYNNASIGLNKEFGSSIYKDDMGYYYTMPNISEVENLSVIPSTDKTKGIPQRIAVIHSHASIIVMADGMCINAGNNFSTGDIEFSNNYNCDNYVATPTGRLLHYKKKTKKTNVLSTSIPYTVKAKKQIMKSWNKDVETTQDKYKKWYVESYKTVNPIVDFFNFMFYMGNDFPNLVEVATWKY